jgi:hypothetical protein
VGEISRDQSIFWEETMVLLVFWVHFVITGEVAADWSQFSDPQKFPGNVS